MITFAASLVVEPVEVDAEADSGERDDDAGGADDGLGLGAGAHAATIAAASASSTPDRWTWVIKPWTPQADRELRSKVLGIPSPSVDILE